jgi:hypothetical protein
VVRSQFPSMTENPPLVIIFPDALNDTGMIPVRPVF